MNLVINLFINTLAVLTGTYLLNGVHVDGVKTALIVAIVIALLNTILKPILIILTLPVTLLTLGMFLLVINGALILFAAKLVDGFRVDGFWWALAFSILISLVGSVLHSFL